MVKTNQKALADKDINLISRCITHLAFRNGPVEDMHSNGQLSEEDMKTLNKFMVNQLATLLTAIKQGRFSELDRLFRFLCRYGTEWDNAELDDTLLNKMLNLSGYPHAEQSSIFQGVDYNL